MSGNVAPPLACCSCLPSSKGRDALIAFWHSTGPVAIWQTLEHYQLVCEYRIAVLEHWVDA